MVTGKRMILQNSLRSAFCKRAGRKDRQGLCTARRSPPESWRKMNHQNRDWKQFWLDPTFILILLLRICKPFALLGGFLMIIS